MKFCAQCGAQLEDNAVFCNSCGAKQSDNNVNVAAAPAGSDANLAKNDAPANNINLAKNDAPANNINLARNDAPANNANSVKNDSTNNSSFAPANAVNINNTVPNNNVNVSSNIIPNNNVNYAPANDNPEPVNNQTLNNAKRQTRNKMVGLIAVIITVLLIAGVACFFIFNFKGNSYKKPINDLVKTINSQSTNIMDYVDCAVPDFAINTLNDFLKILKSAAPDAYEEYEDVSGQIEDMYDNIIDEVGKDFKVSVEIKNAERVEKDSKDWDKLLDSWDEFIDELYDFELDDEDTMDDIATYFEDQYDGEFSDKDFDKLCTLGENFYKDLDNMKIQDAYTVKYKLTAEGKDDSSSTKGEIYVVKVNGKWIIDPIMSIQAAASFIF